MSRLALVLCAALIAAAAAGAAPAPYLIQGDAKVAGLELGHSSLAAARARFGAPSTVRPIAGGSCVATWKPLGLTLSLLDVSTGKGCTRGALLTATMTSRTHWRTVLGLRVGDSVARVKRLYPRSSLHGGGIAAPGYWLITRHACAEAGRFAYPGLLARIAGGHVTAIVAATTACE